MSESRPGATEVQRMRALVKELREAPPPQLDWDRIERGLMQRIARHQRAAGPPATARRWSKVAGFAVAAAALVLMVLAAGAGPDGAGMSRQAPAMDVALSTLALQDVAGEAPAFAVSALPVRARVHSDAAPVRFTHRGVATWELAPGGQVVIDRVATPPTVTLLRGSLHARVTPQRDSRRLTETFAVEAGTTRIAVHGTELTVARSCDSVAVTVAHGVVTVGPAGHRGITTGRLLIGPATAVFSLQGGRLIERLPPTEIEAVARAGGSGGKAAATGAPSRLALPGAAPAAEAGAATTARRTTGEGGAAQPSADGDAASGAAPESSGQAPEAALTAAGARALVRDCIAQHLAAEPVGGTAVTVSSRVTATPGATGSIDTVRFEPPLRPAVQQRCGALLFGRRLAQPGALSFRVSIEKH